MDTKKDKDIKEVFNNLSQENQDIMLLLAKGVEIAQNKQQTK